MKRRERRIRRMEKSEKKELNRERKIKSSIKKKEVGRTKLK